MQLKIDISMYALTRTNTCYTNSEKLSVQRNTMPPPSPTTHLLYIETVKSPEMDISKIINFVVNFIYNFNLGFTK